MMRLLTAITLVGSLSITWVADDMKLTAIRKVYLEKMPNDLDQYIAAEITKQLQGRLIVVLQKEDADAILRGTGDQKTGVGAAITGRYLGLHDNATGSVSLIDKDERLVIWSSEAGDRSFWKGTLARGGLRKVAERLVHDLKDAIAKAPRVPVSSSTGAAQAASTLSPARQPDASVSSATAIAGGVAPTLPSLAKTYTVGSGSVLTLDQHADVLDATFTYANGTRYASARLRWNATLSAFDGTGMIAMMCDKVTVDTPFMLQIMVVNGGSVRERYSSPQQVDCRTGMAKSYSSEELVWTVPK